MYVIDESVMRKRMVYNCSNDKVLARHAQNARRARWPRMWPLEIGQSALLCGRPSGDAHPVSDIKSQSVWNFGWNGTDVVLYYIVYGTHVRNSLYNNIRSICVVMCVNAM